MGLLGAFVAADHAAGLSYYDIYKTQVGKYSIPIIFFHPSENLNTESLDNVVIQQIDIMPTILGYLNYPDTYFAFGHDAFDENVKHFALSYAENAYQLISEKRESYKKIVYKLNQSSIKLYTTDKLLKKNMLGKVQGVQNDMEEFLKAFIQQYNHRMIEDKLTIDE